MYECVFIVKPEITQENLDTFVQNCKQEIAKDAGEIMGVEHWGVRNLSYPIKKLTRGNYIMFKITRASNALGNLHDFARFHNDVLRYAVFRVDNLSSEPSELVPSNKPESDYPRRSGDYRSDRTREEGAGDEPFRRHGGFSNNFSANKSGETI